MKKLHLKLVLCAAISASSSAALSKDTPPEQPSQTPDWAVVKAQIEAAIVNRLVDPESARIEWSYGFKWGGYKPMLQKRIHGWTTCVFVNGRNRMGGYSGSKPAIVVYNSGIRYLEITDDQYGLDSERCAKAGFPAAPATLASHVVAPAPVQSVADEIAKLAALRDQGIITPEEFDTQKAKLLGGR